MIKTEFFIDGIGDYKKSSHYKYERFIEENRNIEIISVNVMRRYHILLTYKETKK